MRFPDRSTSASSSFGLRFAPDESQERREILVGRERGGIHFERLAVGGFRRDEVAGAALRDAQVDPGLGELRVEPHRHAQQLEPLVGVAVAQLLRAAVGVVERHRGQIPDLLHPAVGADRPLREVEDPAPVGRPEGRRDVGRGDDEVAFALEALQVGDPQEVDRQVELAGERHEELREAETVRACRPRRPAPPCRCGRRRR